MLWRRSAVLPFLFVCLVGYGWISQGNSSARVDERIARLDLAHSAIDRLHRVFLNLYRRSGDEEIYYAVGSSLRGLPYDHWRLAYRGSDAPTWYDRSPPEDGHWHWPYTEVPIEYPILNIPFLVLPSFGAGSLDAYALRFSLMMATLLIAAAALVIRAQPARSVPERWWWMAALLLAQGALAVGRLDALPTFLIALALWAAAERRRATTGIALGLAAAVKLFPALLALPLVFADPEAWRTPRDRWRGALGFAAALGIGFGPMCLIPGSLVQMIHYHITRGLQVESTFATLLGALRLIAGTAVPSTLSYGSFNLDGPTADVLARVCTALTFLAMAGVALVVYRAPPVKDDVSRRDRIALTLLAGTCALWLSAKVFSPQYLTWAIPLVLGVSGKRGRRLTLMLFAILLTTQIYLCGHYETVRGQTPLGVGSLVVRLALIVAFTVMVFRGLVGAPEPDGVPDKAPASGARVAT